MIWTRLFRPLLFALGPERAHHVAMALYSAAVRVPPLGWTTKRLLDHEDERLAVERFGLSFPNPVGLAAGFDKDARWFNQLHALGFGFVEVGTLTAHAQPGNPRPRLFRLPADHALINRFGFNNRGAENAAHRLQGATIRPVLGINIGKSKITPNEEAAGDYLRSLELLHPYAAYFAVNVSSPNTAGLRALQERDALTALLRAVAEKNAALCGRDRRWRPTLVKIAPDLDEAQLEEIVGIAEDVAIDGIIATNTTIARDGLRTPAARVEAVGAGGLSGAPLTVRSREFVRQIRRLSGGRLPIIGVGGILNGDDAWEMIRAGADLVQLYTGFVYGGPSCVRGILRRLGERLDESGARSIDEIVGDAADEAT